MIVNRQRRVSLALGPIRQFLSRVQKTLRLPDESIAVCLLSESQIARLNETHRGKRGPTDVLSFPSTGGSTRNGGSRGGKRGKGARGGTDLNHLPAFSSTPFASPTSATSYLGDIAISPAVARRNARRYGRSLHGELRILILHGVLHLLGYDHETDNGRMSRRERNLRRRLGLA